MNNFEPFCNLNIIENKIQLTSTLVPNTRFKPFPIS